MTLSITTRLPYSIVLYISYAKYFHFEIPVIAANLLYLLKCIAVDIRVNNLLIIYCNI